MEKPTGIKLPTAFPKTLEIERTDSHIPSAPAVTAKLTQTKNPKGAFPSSPVLRSLQAHPSIGKDLMPEDDMVRALPPLRERAAQGWGTPVLLRND
jgi:hypothetical protein